MKLFAIADLHLGFQADKPMAVFGPRWDDHCEKLKMHWQTQVAAEDIVLIPGDISWAMRMHDAAKDLEWLNKLPGKKICIRGNHDYWWDRPTKLNRAYEAITFLQNTAYMVGELAICGTRGWEYPAEGDEADEEQARMISREVMRLELSLETAVKAGAKEIWVMLHYPPTAANETTSAFVELLQKYPVTQVVYGHLHDPLSWQACLKGTIGGINYTLVSADYLDFQPKLIGMRS